MYDFTDEIHHCPECSRATRHRVVRDRVLATTLWCQRCYHLHLDHPAAPAAAEPHLLRPAA